VAFAHLLFNCVGAIIFLPFAPIRNLPVKFAEHLAELCLKNRFIPIVFIVVVFYLIPIIVTWNSIAAAFN
jgi:sodium-dependent phosphate cotransporter